MSVLQKLTLRHLRLNRRRTAITIVGIALSVAMVTAVSGMVVSFQDLLYRESVLKDGLWHVRYRDVPADVVEKVLQEPVFQEGELVDTDDGQELSLLFTRLHKGIFDESEAVCWKYGIGQDQVRYHNDLLVAQGIVPGPYYDALYGFAGILLGLIAIGSVLVISNAFTISSDQRGQQFGLLKSAGATKSQIRGMVLLEGVALAALAIPIGILVGILAQWVALSIANRILEPMVAVDLQVVFRVIVSPAALGVAVLAALVTVFFAAWFPAQRAARVSAVEAIRQNRSIRLTPGSVRVSPITKKLFGFEGVLAAKALARNRGKYRTTILALVVSIVLFIGVSSFGSILIKATGMIYQDMGSNVVVSLNGGDRQLHDSLAAQMASWGDAEIFPSRNVTGSVQLGEENLTREYRSHFSDPPPLRLFSVGQEAYEQLCARLSISPHSGEEETVGGILLNTTGTYIRQGRRINFVPYRISTGDRFPIAVEEQALELEILGATDTVPPGVFTRFQSSGMNVVVSEEAMARILGDQAEDFLWVSALAYDADGFVERAEQLLEEALPSHSWSVMDYEKMVANNRNIGILVMIFVYGFIAMLSLIGITSVITTISTSIALRGREFAMLRSVGMTDASMGRMLGYESLLYGIKALLWGIPLGLLACWLLYKAMTSVMDFPFLWPVRSILISVVAILSITTLTMAFARRKQRQMNIVEALRHDLI